MGPAFSMTRANELYRVTGRDMDKCIRFLEAQAEGGDYLAAARAFAKAKDQVPSIHLARQMKEIALADAKLTRDAAEKNGKLWAICGAMRPGRVAFVIANGPRSETLAAMASVDLVGPEDPVAYVDTTFIGERTDAAKMALDLVNVETYSIRFV